MTTLRRSICVPILVALAAVPLITLPGIAEEGAAEHPTGSVAVGKSLFRVYCASCHGRQGRGDGALAEHLRVQPADLTRLAADNEGEFPAEAVHQAIDGRKDVRGHGDSDMPVWGDVFLDQGEARDERTVEQKVADLVAFLRTIQEVEYGRAEMARHRPPDRTLRGAAD